MSRGGAEIRGLSCGNMKRSVYHGTQEKMQSKTGQEWKCVREENYLNALSSSGATNDCMSPLIQSPQ